MPKQILRHTKNLHSREHVYLKELYDQVNDKFVSIKSTSEVVLPNDVDLGVGGDDSDVSAGFQHPAFELCGRQVQVYKTYSIKSNRGSCWIKTVTIAPPLGKVHSLAYTYPIAIGRKDVSHECVESRFAEELHELRSGNSLFYCKALGGNVNVYADLFVSLQDQPERRSANYIMLGSSKYTARWGIAADFASIACGIPACTACFQGLVFNVGSSSSQSCSNCVNWSIDVESGLLDTPPPPEFSHLFFVNR
jgi:hypothetical protein